MMAQEEIYQAYLLRLQRSAPQADWRISLENAHTGEKLHFSSEKELLRYLWQLLGKPTDDETLPNP
jgi:hypothetical protein